MTYPSVIIPLDHWKNDSSSPSYKSQYRAWTSAELFDELERIAGHGDRLLWWTFSEAQSAIKNGSKWAWIPYGPLDLDHPRDQSNGQTQMEIFFHDPKAATMFKLSWTSQ
jgi:hypothetical protein